MAFRLFPDPQRGVRILNRSRPRTDIDCADRRILVVDRFPAPRHAHELDIPVEQLATRLKIHTTCRELFRQVATGQSELHTPFGEEVQCGHRLGEQERVAQREDRRIHEEPQGRGTRRGGGQRDERIDGIMPVTVEPPVIRWHRMLVEADRIPAGLLRSRRDSGYCRGGQQTLIDRDADPRHPVHELHLKCSILCRLSLGYRDVWPGPGQRSPG